MSRRDRIKDLYAAQGPEKLAAANSDASARVLAGPVRAMSLSLGRMEEESRQWQDALASGATVVELDPRLIEPSMVRDRFEAANDAQFELLRVSIAEHGQESPILVRPHPQIEGRFQVAYGHRRLKAVEALGRKVKAIVRPLTDAELVVAQGVENSARQDLSYIERARFAAALEDRGFERSTIMAALSTDKGELSKLISVARRVPGELIDAIGPAPKTGRRRWLALAEALAAEGVARRLERLARQRPFLELDSDARFARALAQAAIRPAREAPREWRRADGAVSVKITPRALVVDARGDQGFVAFLERELDRLYEAYLARGKAKP
jgi:ParB family chromosome partitioning protein